MKHFNTSQMQIESENDGDDEKTPRVLNKKKTVIVKRNIKLN